MSIIEKIVGGKKKIPRACYPGVPLAMWGRLSSLPLQWSVTRLLKKYSSGLFTSPAVTGLLWI
jgi:hypothetical protein